MILNLILLIDESIEITKKERFFKQNKWTTKKKLFLKKKMWKFQFLSSDTLDFIWKMGRSRTLGSACEWQ